MCVLHAGDAGGLAMEEDNSDEDDVAPGVALLGQ